MGRGLVSLGSTKVREGGRAKKRMSRWLCRHHRTINRLQTHCLSAAGAPKEQLEQTISFPQTG